jgi:hypothetical protein
MKAQSGLRRVRDAAGGVPGRQNSAKVGGRSTRWAERLQGVGSDLTDIGTPFGPGVFRIN